MRTATNPETGERVFFNEDTRAWEPMPGSAPNPAQPITGRDIGRHVAQGGLLGFGDEAQAGMFALMDTARGTGDIGQSYDRYVADERADIDRFRQQHPAMAIGSELAGGLATGIGGGMAAQGTNLAKNIAARGLVPRMLASSAVGGGTGAVAGAGEARSMAEVPEMAGKGALIGAIASPVVEAGTTGVKAAARTLSPQRSAERAVRRAAKRGMMTLEQTKAKIKKLGPEATLADANEGLLSELDRLVNTPGAVRTKALSQLSKRSGRQMNEILDATGEGNYFEHLDTIKKFKSEAASPVYERAYTKGVQHTDDLEDIFDGIQKAYPEAWGEAKRIGSLDFTGKGQAIPDLGEARPSLRGWQAMKEFLDDKRNTLFRAGSNKEAAKVRDVTKRMLRELDNQNPEYAAAREMWAGAAAFESAMDEGKRFMRPGISSAELRHTFKAMSEADKFAYREGARQAIQDTVERAGFTHDTAKFFRTPAMTAKLRTLYGNREAAKVLRKIVSSSTKQRTFSTVAGNSKTALRQAAQAEEALAPEVMAAMADFATSNPVSAGGNVARQVIRKMPTSREATRDIIGDMLLEADPAKQQAIIQQLLGGGKPLPPNTGAGLLAPINIGIAGGLLSGR